MNDVTRRIAAWIACCVMLFAALAPSLSHAMSALRGETWTEICSPGGPKLMKITSHGTLAEAQSDSAAGVHLEHCAMCAALDNGPCLPPGDGLVFSLIEQVGARHPLLFYQSASPLAIWTPSQSRAPPART